MQHDVNQICVHVNETSVYTRKTCDWVANGNRVFRQINNGPNLTLMAIAFNTGVLYYESLREAMKTVHCGDCFHTNFANVLPDESAFIIVKNVIHTMKTSPPYLLFLNPIEEVFSNIKAAINAKFSDEDFQRQRIVQRLNLQKNEQGSGGVWRKQY